VKFEHCVVNHVMTEIDVSCLPADLPEFIEVDLSWPEEGQVAALATSPCPRA
jgi:large subunit ribosomal protein L25